VRRTRKYCPASCSIPHRDFQCRCRCFQLAPAVVVKVIDLVCVGVCSKGPTAESGAQIVDKRLIFERRYLGWRWWCFVVLLSVLRVARVSRGWNWRWKLRIGWLGEIETQGSSRFARDIASTTSEELDEGYSDSVVYAAAASCLLEEWH
jgi:hypothetical protein